jgi:hypothetical protein
LEKPLHGLKGYAQQHHQAAIKSGSPFLDKRQNPNTTIKVAATITASKIPNGNIGEGA